MLSQADSACSRRTALPEHEPDPSTSLAAQAVALGRDPADLLYDWTIADDGEALVHYFLGGNGGYLDATLEILAHPATVLGLGDGGAHVDLVCDAGYPSFVLWYWVRERDARHAAARDRDPRAHERARRACTACAIAARSRPGYKADLNVLDTDAIKPHPVEVVLRPSRGREARPAARRRLRRDDRRTGRSCSATATTPVPAGPDGARGAGRALSRIPRRGTF